MEKSPLEGFKIGWIITSAEDALERKQPNKAAVDYLKEVLEEHYNTSKRQGYALCEESALTHTLIFDSIPSLFGIVPGKDSYKMQDYLAGLELVIEQFEDIENASETRLQFLRKFVKDLERRRTEKLRIRQYHY